MRTFSSTRKHFNNLDSANKMYMPKINIRNNNDQGKNRYDYLDDISKEQLSLLNNLWDDLGVTDKYRNIFLDSVNESDRENIFYKEKKVLFNLRDSLKKLRNNIINRENNIKNLKNYNDIIQNYISEGKIVSKDSELFQSICNIIKNLRINAINIVNLLCDLNKVIFANPAKWDLEKLKKDFLFDGEYLNKMKEDLKFLQNSVLSKFIEMQTTEIDPFLTCCAPSLDRKNTKLKVPISEEIMTAINDSRLLLIKESILTSNNNNNNDDINININNINNEQKIKRNYYSQLNLNTDSKMNFDKNKIKINNNNNNIEQTHKTNRSINNNRSFKKLKINEFPGNITNLNISREIHKNKVLLGRRNYNDLFYKNSPIYKQFVNPKRKKIKLIDYAQDPSKYFILDKLTKNRIYIERDEIISNAEANTLLRDEKSKNKKMNNELIELKKSNIEYKKKCDELQKSNQEFKKIAEEEKKKRTNIEKDVDILQIKLKEKSNTNQELLDQMKKISKRKDINYEENELNEKMKELEDKLKNKENENNKNKEEIEKLLKIIEGKDEEIKRLKDEIKNLKIIFEQKEEINRLKGEIKELKSKPLKEYEVEFYKENISNLLNSLTDVTPLNQIPDFLKRAFNINESIFKEEFYFKGIFPKIILCKKKEGNNDIKGLCSLFFENNEDLSENLVLRVNCIYAIEDFENIIISMINFIKENMKFDKLVVNLQYDKKDDKFVMNKEAKDIFQNKLEFKWLCVFGEEEKKQRYIKLYYSKKTSKSNNEENKSRNMFKNNFFLDNLTIITTNDEEGTNFLKNKIGDNSDINELEEKKGHKYINKNSVYSLLLANQLLKIEFQNENKEKELKEMKDKLWKFVCNEFNWNMIEEDQRIIKDINIDDSLFHKIQKYYKNNETNLTADFRKKNISINFESINSILIDDYYYNRISCDKIKIFKEEKTNSTFFLIPSLNNSVFFYLSEVNEKLSELLINSENNIYDQFLEFQPNSQKELVQLNSSNINDDSSSKKTEQKIIYIPSFKIKEHLCLYNVKEIKDNIKINIKENNKELYLTSVDEYINIDFTPDYNLNNSFAFKIPEEDKNFIIKNSFIIGIFSNDILNNDKLPLMQFIYIKKEQFLTKSNYMI